MSPYAPTATIWHTPPKLEDASAYITDSSGLTSLRGELFDFFEVTLRVAHTPELERWLFSYDEDFRLIEPATLKAGILRKSGGLAANHAEK